jgi:hypothetical protein
LLVGLDSGLDLATAILLPGGAKRAGYWPLA